MQVIGALMGLTKVGKNNKRSRYPFFHGKINKWENEQMGNKMLTLLGKNAEVSNKGGHDY